MAKTERLEDAQEKLKRYDEAAGKGLTFADVHDAGANQARGKKPDQIRRGAGGLGEQQSAEPACPADKHLGKVELSSQSPNAGMKVSEKALELIKHFEGLRLEPYSDCRRQLAIGYGHHIKKAEQFPNGITEKEAAQLLRKDLQCVQADVSRMVTVPLSQAQFDALVSFEFNVGPTNFRKSTLLKKLNEGDYAGASREFDRWIYAGKPAKVMAGLVRRRATEKAQFLT